ncbi:hypothetical protein HGP16_26385 [Rhizobium sp. P40RR-XXII]|uniref:hypothetical protein n=1 Tax=unclassified Rhizobium TaxID=2613769 RepID=UPI001456A929|nr:MULTISPECIES: hypothetical protein [unclassified Rhizobium]NLR85411.1 hypothetical protein [Rhizobium sp. P28RR-XV]NLS20069.1 hypothetical protein [Rhizobium sp. P40RR-XXII]
MSQTNLGDWFELIDNLVSGEDRYLFACHLAEFGYAIGDLADYAAELTEDSYQLPKNIVTYFDFERAWPGHGPLRGRGKRWSCHR